MVRRGPGEPKLCRSICAPRKTGRIIESRSTSRNNPPTSKSSQQSSVIERLHSLSKRVLRLPPNIDNFMVDRFENAEEHSLTEVYQADVSVSNSAEFRTIDEETAKFELGVEGLCGCTVVVVVSRQAVWFSHFLLVHTLPGHDQW